MDAWASSFPLWALVNPSSIPHRVRAGLACYDLTYGQPYDAQGASLPRIIASDDLRARLGRELDALKETPEALYVSKRGRLAGVLVDADHYAELLERIDYLEDSLAALQARVERDDAIPWAEVRE
jgi:prevent-host-death family protein